MKNFKWSVLISTVLVALGGYWGFSQGGLTGAVSAMYIVLVLAAMEVSLSFDNAVVNAGVLKDMSVFWRKMFLTVGIFVAVFGMRLVFPVAIVSVSADMGMLEVARLALDNPTEYSRQLSAHSAEVSTFGGIFLLMVFLSYFFDSEKDVHWVHWLESRMSKYGDMHYLIATIAMATVFLIYAVVPTEIATKVFIAGMSGIMTYVMVDVVGDYLGGDGEAVARSGAGAFLYLEVLDASFSFDGVIGAFAITNDIVIIMLGLGIGAFFVRSITVYLVEKGTLTEYRFLEHGAHYAIGALALIMLLSLKVHIPEVVTGLIGIALIAISVWASKKHSNADEKVAAAYDPQVDVYVAKHLGSLCNENGKNNNDRFCSVHVFGGMHYQDGGDAVEPKPVPAIVEMRHCRHASEATVAHKACPLYDPEERQSACYRYVEEDFCMAKPKTVNWRTSSYDEYVESRMEDTIFTVTESSHDGVSTTTELNASELKALLTKRCTGADQYLQVTWKHGATDRLSVDVTFYDVNIFKVQKMESLTARVSAELKSPAFPYSEFVVTRCSLTGSSAETVSSWKLTGLVAAVARDENAAIIEVTWIDGTRETVNMAELRSAMLAGRDVRRIKIAAEMQLVAYQKAYYDNESEDKTKPRYKLWHVGNDGKAQNVHEPLLAVEIADYVQMLSRTWYSAMAYVEYADSATFVDRQALEVNHLEGMESLTVERMNMDFRVLKVTPI